MKLTLEEQDMVAGKYGTTVQHAIKYQVQVGDFYQVDRFIPITNAHFTGDFEVMDDGGVDYLKSLAGPDAKVRVPTTRNSTCVDPTAANQLRQKCSMVDGEAQVGPMLSRMGVITANTCIGYQTVYTPSFGEHLAWGDTGTVAYANSVLGARTNYEAGPSSLFAGLTGRTPAFGFHVDESRRANVHCTVDAAMDDLADWGALGAIIGKEFRGYWNVPVFEFTKAHATPDRLKHLAASLASYGSMAMFHAVGFTPEAQTLQDAIGDRELIGQRRVTDDDIDAVYAGYDTGDGVVDIVVFTAPQLSVVEIQEIAGYLDGQRAHDDVEIILTTNSMVATAAKEQGLDNALSRSGAMLLTGTCWYLMDPAEMQKQFGWQRIVTNSAKLANIIRAHGYSPVLRRTPDCTDAAVTGKVS